MWALPSERETAPTLVRMQPSVGVTVALVYSHQAGDSLSLSGRAQNVNYSPAPNLVMVVSNHAAVKPEQTAAWKAQKARNARASLKALRF